MAIAGLSNSHDSNSHDSNSHDSNSHDSNSHDLSPAPQRISQAIESAIGNTARERSDWSFPVRLELAKVRSLLKLIELDIKRVVPRPLPVNTKAPADQPTVLVQLYCGWIET